MLTANYAECDVPLITQKLRDYKHRTEHYNDSGICWKRKAYDVDFRKRNRYDSNYRLPFWTKRSATLQWTYLLPLNHNFWPIEWAVGGHTSLTAIYGERLPYMIINYDCVAKRQANSQVWHDTSTDQETLLITSVLQVRRINRVSTYVYKWWQTACR